MDNLSATQGLPDGIRWALHAEGGTLKRVDEIRELYELLCEDGVILRYPWIAGWLRSEDAFLCGVAAAARETEPGIDDTYLFRAGMCGPDTPFPRPAPDYSGSRRTQAPGAHGTPAKPSPSGP